MAQIMGRMAEEIYEEKVYDVTRTVFRTENFGYLMKSRDLLELLSLGFDSWDRQ